MFYRIYSCDKRILNVPALRSKIEKQFSLFPVEEKTEGGSFARVDPAAISDARLLYYRSLRADILIDERLRTEFGEGAPLRIGRLPGGKPYLADFPDLHISISHSGDLVVVGIADSLIGLDIQKIRELPLKVADRFYPPADLAAIKSAPSREAASDLFFRIWTIREAYTKFTGRGLAEDLTSFDIFPERHLIIKQPSYYREGNVLLSPSCCYKELTPPLPGYRMSACMIYPDLKPLVCLLTAETAEYF